MNLTSAIGNVAAVCTTFAFVPQLVKIRRQGGDDLSYPMLVFYLTGIVLWLVYGLMIHAAAVIWANAATAVLVTAAIAMKAAVARKTRPDSKAGARLNSTPDEACGGAVLESAHRAEVPSEPT